MSGFTALTLVTFFLASTGPDTISATSSSVAAGWARTTVSLKSIDSTKVKFPTAGANACTPGVVPSVERQDLLDYLRGDWRRNLTASLRTLHEHRHRNLRAFIWRESDKPSVVIFVAVSPKLCCPRFSSDGDTRDLGSRCGVYPWS